MRIFFIILNFIFSISILNASCYVSNDCETPLKEMEQNLTKKINYSFDLIDKEIDLLNEEYKNDIKEIDKELYTARIRLEAEQTLYLKLLNIENLIKKNVQLNSLNITTDLIVDEISNKKE